MRILAVSGFYPPDTVGGYEWAAWEVLRRLAERGHAVRVLCGRPPARLAAEARTTPEVERSLGRIAEGADAPRGGRRTRAFVQYLRNARALRRALARERPDALYLWGCSVLTPAVLAVAEEAARGGCPAVFHLEDDWVVRLLRQGGGGSRAERWSRAIRARLAGLPPRDAARWRFVYVSEAMRRVYEEAGVRPAAWEVIHNGHTPEAPPRTWPATPPARWRCGFVGRLRPNKGIEVALEAFARLREAGVEAGLEVVGAGEAAYEKELRERAQTLGIGGDVRWSGRRGRDATLAAFRTFDLALVPSLWEEPFGLVAIEAMAAGVPVLAANRGALPEIVTPACGWCVEPTPERLAEAAAAALADPDGLRRRGEEGARRARSAFAWEDKVERVEAFLRSSIEAVKRGETP